MKDIKRNIQKKIAHTAEDNLLNHLKTFWRSDGKLTGIVNEDGFTVWASHYYLGGIVHVIVDGVFTDQKVLLSTRINIVGKIFILLFLSVWIVVTFLFIFNHENSWTFSVGLILSWLFLLAMIIVPLIAGYSLERKNILSKVHEIINTP